MIFFPWSLCRAKGPRCSLRPPHRAAGEENIEALFGAWPSTFTYVSHSLSHVIIPSCSAVPARRRADDIQFEILAVTLGRYDHERAM